MPRFYFDLDDGRHSTPDEEGGDHVDAEAARKELVGSLAQMANDQLPDGNVRDFYGILKDANGKALFKATISLRSGWIT
ncbi:DUF6894 family protein [Methylobacterium brachythecii]|uniref:DUF6894 domain-containing protein n=1 Tax=Methylobacterium brachythecii TaxID=1176177 RepID=A0A7W6F6W6_9HYPH|nr:hypothetical protein [Methylobacterium brachythecii]MBB3902779.1 hypothetical protein [Methylobacterium brachythecii]GLS46983.1 hypothetical protein GCM10007884_49830 [Methylobacterium brachythecii]